MADEYPINYNILAEDFKDIGKREFTQEEAMWLYESLCKMCNAYDELVDESDNMTTTTGFDPNVTWFPFIKNGMAGFRCVKLDTDEERFIYMNPSTDGEGKPDVFVYEGPHQDPADDGPICFYVPRFTEDES